MAKTKQRPRRCMGLYRMHRFAGYDLVVGCDLYYVCERCGYKQFRCSLSEGI